MPSGSDKLYTGSTDETVRVWDCQSGKVCYYLFLFCLVFLVSILNTQTTLFGMLCFMILYWWNRNDFFGCLEVWNLFIWTRCETCLPLSPNYCVKARLNVIVV